MRGPPNLLAQIGSPTPRFAALRVPDSRSAARRPSAVLDFARAAKETAMTIISAVSKGSGDAFARLVEGLRLEFGDADIGALAERIFEAEKADFHWQARVRERYLGQHFPLEPAGEGETEDLARVAILSFVRGSWHAGVCIVDGEGCITELLWLRSFAALDEASEMFARAR